MLGTICEFTFDDDQNKRHHAIPSSNKELWTECNYRISMGTSSAPGSDISSDS
jgi:hypothetical protein